MGVVTSLRRALRGNTLLALSAGTATLTVGGIAIPTVTYAQTAMRQLDLGVELGAKTFVMWGGREGAEYDAAKDIQAAFEKRFRFFDPTHLDERRGLREPRSSDLVFS